MIIENSMQNVNGNAGIFLAKQVLDKAASFKKFDERCNKPKSRTCQTYSNSSIIKSQVALMVLGKTSYCDIVAHQKDDLFADAIC